MQAVHRLALIAVLLAFISSGTVAQSTYKDRDHHYQMHIPKNWEGVPVEIRDKSTGMVSKWAFKRSLRGYAGRIHVYIFKRTGNSWAQAQKLVGAGNGRCGCRLGRQPSGQ